LVSYVLRPVPRVLFGATELPEPPKSLGSLALVGAAWLLVLGAGMVALLGWTRPNWTLAALWLTTSVTLYCASVMAGGAALARYEYAPGLMALTALAALLSPRPGAPRSRAPLLVLAALVTVVCAVNLRTPNLRAEGPVWDQSLREARTACAGRPANAMVPTAISPTERHIAAELPCGYLR
jgi:hypothetical protein